MKDIIAAIGTPPGRGGVAIIRLSGEGCLDVAKKMFSRRGDYQPNMLYPGRIDCGTFTDFGMCVYFRAPRSFTGEDCVEFHCHGGTEIARGVLAQAVSCGARLAGRGEFTKRAFLNGKLSLSAAEGMADMINADSASEVRAGFLLYGETLTREGKRMQALLTECLAGIDADIDYPEEDLSRDTRAEVKEKLEEVLRDLTALKEQYRSGKKIKEGVCVAICGKPNAGKSSLLNRLLGYEKAIVSPIAGTTRDIVEGQLEINGVRFILTDTAGLHESDDEVEIEGIRRARNAISAADVILFVKEEEGEAPSFPEGVPVVTVGSKSDLGGDKRCDLSVSAKTGEGVEELKQLLYEKGFGRGNDGAYLLEERHYAAVCDAIEYIGRAIEGTERELPAELYATDIKSAWDKLGEISGETATEEIIGEIFAKFCVGK